MSKYDTTVDPTNLSSSHGLMVDLVGTGKRVLDVGCASGYLGRVLMDRGCTVVGVEYDPEAAAQAEDVLEKVVVADLETVDLVEVCGADTFDVVVFGDVLEHLKDPQRVLRRAADLLTPDGYVVISLPHVAHGDVRLALLQGRFDYTPTGLLDSTHLRFFTRSAVHQMLSESGFVAADFRRTTTPLFTTELGVRREDFPPELVERIEQDADATTYQFVLSAVPHRGSEAVKRLHELNLELQVAGERLARAHRELGERDRLVQRLRADLDREQRRAEAAEHAAEHAGSEVERLYATRTLRSTRLVRAVYGRLRSANGS
ncbi:class I SAM-dependent methyltransferase [Thalassiella azotivora]